MATSVYIILTIFVAFVSLGSSGSYEKEPVNLKVFSHTDEGKKETQVPIMDSYADVPVGNRAFFGSSVEEKEEDTNRIDFQSYLRMYQQKPWHNPDEEGKGDIIMDARSRVGISGDIRWPNATVPFVIKNVKESALNTLKQIFLLYHTHTCIRFIPRTDEEDYIIINGGADSCLSYCGKMGNDQEVQLSNTKCFDTFGTPFHELMHALGFDHEQSRVDRDNYVAILKDNIPADRIYNFEKSENTPGVEVPYDFGSVMHYTFFAFAKDTRFPSMVSLHKLPPNIKVGQRLGPSVFDLKKINVFYECDNYR